MRLHRLFGILSILLSRETITAKELAERFEVSIRTIYRDIQAIEEAGIPLYATPGNSGGIGIVAEYKLNKTVLSEDEMSYLMTGLSGLKTIADTDQLQILLSKLSTSSSYLTADSDILIDFSAWNKSMTASLKQRVETIRLAILNKNYLLVDYLSARRRSSVKIAPAKVIFKSAGWYLFGQSAEQEVFRFYKISRIAGMEISNETFTPQQPEIPSDWSDDFAADSGEPVTVAFDEALEYQVIDIFGPGNYTRTDKKLIVTFPCADEEWLLHFILGYGIRAEILEPAHLRKAYFDYLKKILERSHC